KRRITRSGPAESSPLVQAIVAAAPSTPMRTVIRTLGRRALAMARRLPRTTRPRAEVLRVERALARGTAAPLDPIRSGIRARADDPMQPPSDEMQRRAIVCRVAGRQQSSSNHVVIRRPTRGLSVIVRAVTAAEPSERIHRRELGSERIAHAGFEPAE